MSFQSLRRSFNLARGCLQNQQVSSRRARFLFPPGSYTRYICTTILSEENKSTLASSSSSFCANSATNPLSSSSPTSSSSCSRNLRSMLTSPSNSSRALTAALRFGNVVNNGQIREALLEGRTIFSSGGHRLGDARGIYAVCRSYSPPTSRRITDIMGGGGVLDRGSFEEAVSNPTKIAQVS